MKKLLLSVVLLSFSYVCSAQLQVDLGGAFSFEYVGLNTDGTVKYDVYFNYSSDSSWAGSTSTSFGRYRKVSQAAALSAGFYVLCASGWETIEV